jgi:hypothetical protein
MTDVITAAERAWFETSISRVDPLYAYERDLCLKLLRLYDAALARAEAAERKQGDAEFVAKELQSEVESANGLLSQRAQDIAQHKDRLFTAESALAEATACITGTLAELDKLREGLCALDIEPVDSDLVAADIDDASCGLRAFLSRTPAPAAKAGE